MPISPDKKKLYPSNWREISLHIRARANNCCEMCGVQNGAVGARDKQGVWHDADEIEYMNSDYGMSMFGTDFPKMIKIVLTVAHMNHDETDCSDDNLKALCQRCHLTYDAQHHADNAAITRSRKKHAAAEAAGQQELFSPAPVGVESTEG